MNAKLLTASGLALAVALGASPASAQTVISRTIAPEPVETVVTQSPSGTVVTRRPVEAPIAAPAIAPATTVVETVPDTVDAITTREVVRRAEVTRTAPRLMSRQVSARSEPRVTRSKVVRKTTAVRTSHRPAPRLALSSRERHIVYRTIIEREVVQRPEIVVAPAVAPAPYVNPAPYVAPAPLVTRQVALPAPAPVIADDDEVVVERPIAIGTVLPANVPLYALPQNVALGVPAIRSYSYAWIGGRAYLVDPATGIVVADVTE